MAEFSWSALVKAAEEEGLSTKIPAQGDYDAVVKATNSGQSQSGKPSVGLMFVITTPGPEQGTSVWANQYLSIENPVAMRIWFEQWANLGITPDDFTRAPEDLKAAVAWLAQEAEGRSARIRIKHREWNGNTQADVKVLRGGGGSAAPAPVTPSAAPQPAPVNPFMADV